MSRTQTVRNAKNTKTKTDDARLFFRAVRKALRPSRGEVAEALVKSAKEGNNTAMKTLVDLITFTEPPREPDRIENLKRLSELEAECKQYAELSEETADGFPSGREPE